MCASKLASTYVSLFYRSVHVLYTGLECQCSCIMYMTWVDILQHGHLFKTTPMMSISGV